jgi:hypothetical protein
MQEAWKKSGFRRPKVLLAVNENSGENFIVVEDDSTIFKLMSRGGHIFVVAGFRCTLQQDKNGSYYTCSDPMHPISCSKLEHPKEKFAKTLIEYLNV